MENDDDLLSKIIFSDEATFHLSGKVNRYNMRIWGVGGVKIRKLLWRLNVTLQNSMCTACSSLRDKPLLAEVTWKC